MLGMPKINAEIFIRPLQGHIIVEKFSAILLTDTDDISQSTPNVWPIFEL